jgi:hypothetical protein
MTEFLTNTARISNAMIASMIDLAVSAIRFTGLVLSAAIVLTCAGILALNFYHVEIAEFVLNWGSYFTNQTMPNRWILDH